MPISITADEIKKIVNLDKVQKNELIDRHISLIDMKIQEYSLESSYNSVVDNSADDITITAYKTAFSYLMFAQLMPFLNTNTAGSGIVKSTGFNESKIDLLSQAETEKRQQSAELEALKFIKKHLNTTGLERLDKLIFWDELNRVDVDNIEAKASIINQKLSPRKCRISLI